MKSRTIRVAIIILIILSLVNSFTQVHADNQSFEALSTTFKSSASTDVYPGSRGAQLRVDVRYRGATPVYAVVGCLENLPNGVTPSLGSSLCSPARDLNGSTVIEVKGGDVVYFNFYLDVNRSVIPGTYMVNLVVSYRNSTGLHNESIPVRIAISQYPELRFDVVDSSWAPGAYPGTIDTALRVTLRNNGECNLRSAIVRVSLPSGMRPSQVQAQMGYVAVGNQVTLQFSDIDIDESLTAGYYSATLTIDGVAETPDGVAYSASSTLVVQVKVDSLTSDLFVLNPITIQWGEARPQPSYQGSRYIPLTVTILNIGEYDAVSLKLNASSPHLRPIKSVDVYSARIPAGGSCSLTLYFDIAVNAPATFSIVMSLEYWVDLGGGTLVKVRSNHSSPVFIEEYVGARDYGIYVVSEGWLNNYNVFPNTENATYQVVIANRLPFQVSGVRASLKLPSGFYGDEEGRATSYLDGPIPSYSSATLSFRISVGNVMPGSYEVVLELDYIAHSGGPGIRRNEVHKVTMVVVNDSNAVELISTSWLGSSAEPNTYGMILRVDVRNNFIDSMDGVVLELNLPKGFLSSLDNTSRIKIASASPELIQMTQQLTPQNIQALISMLRSMATSPAQQRYSRGDMITFVVPLNVLVNSTGVYWSPGKISYIDSWGCRREYSVNVPLYVLGSTKYIDVRLVGSFNVKSKYTNMTLTLRNVGSASAHNVYLTIRPAQGTPILIATPSTVYLDALEANSEIGIPITFAFNPLGYQTVMGATTIVNYGVVPFTISISYKDASGYLHSYDTSITIALEPFIDVVARDLRAELYDGSARVSGVLINYGSAIAYRIEVKVVSGNVSSSSFIGDLEPGGQVAFRVDLNGVKATSNIVNVIIGYYNIFNEYELRELNISMTRIQRETEVTVQGSPIPTLSIVVIVAVTVLLAVVGLFVYRLYRSHMRRLHGGVATQ